MIQLIEWQDGRPIISIGLSNDDLTLLLNGTGIAADLERLGLEGELRIMPDSGDMAEQAKAAGFKATVNTEE